MSNLERAGRRLDVARAAFERRPGPHAEHELEAAEQAYEDAAQLTPAAREAAAERLERAGYPGEAFQLRHAHLAPSVDDMALDAENRYPQGYR